MIDRLRLFADQLTPVLHGDRAEILQPVGYLSADEQLDADRPHLDADTVIDLALGLPTHYGQRMVNQVLGGTSLVGWPGCAAEGLRDAIGVAGPDLLLTDRRLLVVKQIATDQPFELRWEQSRRAVLSVRRAPRFGQAGRVWVVLADGSGLAVITGYVTGGAAHRFVAAWGTTSDTTLEPPVQPGG